jgi:hypothetical protein
MSQTGAQNVGGFVVASLKNTNEEIAELSKQRNFAGGFWGAISALGTIFLKTYADNIVASIGRLAGLSH